QGDVGPQGAQGAQGPQGNTGAQGPKGDAGAQGPQGNVGQQGVQGPAGDQGPVGAVGPAGSQGPQGDIGPAGPAGPTGPAGQVNVIIRKTADESLANSTTVQNDDQLSFAVGANESWVFEAWIVIFSSQSAPKFKMTFTVPTGATIRWSGLG